MIRSVHSFANNSLGVIDLGNARGRETRPDSALAGCRKTRDFYLDELSLLFLNLADCGHNGCLANKHCLLYTVGPKRAVPIFALIN